MTKMKCMLVCVCVCVCSVTNTLGCQSILWLFLCGWRKRERNETELPQSEMNCEPRCVVSEHLSISGTIICNKLTTSQLQVVFAVCLARKMVVMVVVVVLRRVWSAAATLERLHFANWSRCIFLHWHCFCFPHRHSLCSRLKSAFLFPL